MCLYEYWRWAFRIRSVHNYFLVASPAFKDKYANTLVGDDDALVPSQR